MGAKFAVLGGVGFVILNVIGVILQGSPPKANDSGDKVLAWFADKESGIRLGGFLGALSIILLLWWFGTLWRRMADAETNQNRLSVLSLIGLAGSGALFAASAAITSTVALRFDEIPAAEAKFFYTMAGVVLSMSGAFVVVHLVATNVLALRTSFLPKGVALFGLLPAAAFLVSTSGAMSDGDLPMIAGLIGFIGWMLWILATSFHMWKTAD